MPIDESLEYITGNAATDEELENIYATNESGSLTTRTGIWNSATVVLNDGTSTLDKDKSENTKIHVDRS